MTNKQAIKWLKDYIQNTPFQMEQYEKAFDMAIKALSQEPTDEMVHVETLRQVMWERDIAIEQLHELGYGFGQKIEPCDDAISREAVLDTLDQMDKILDVDRTVENYKDLLKESYQVLPSVTQKSDNKYRKEAKRWKNKWLKSQKSGKWVEIDDEPHEVWECDHCGFVIDGSGCIEPYEYRDIYKYCPNCGARMESEEQTE